MSHEVQKNDTVTCADGCGTWHNKNTLIVPEMDSFASTRLDWRVGQYPLVLNKDNSYIPVDGYFVNLRQDIDLPLGVVGDQYQVIQNEQIYDKLVEIFRGNAELVTAGSLFDCRRIWFLAKLNQGDRVINGDVYENYLLAHSSHDGSSTLYYRLTSVRVVCNNTLTMAVNSSKTSFKISHSGETEVKLDQVVKFYDEIFHGIDKTQAILEILANRECNIETAYNWASGYVSATSTKSQNISRQIVNMFATGDGNRGETRYDLLNGLTQRLTHGDPTQDQDSDRIAKEFITSTFGSNNSKKLNALASLQDDDKFAKTVEIGKKLNADYLDSEVCAKTASLVSINRN